MTKTGRSEGFEAEIVLGGVMSHGHIFLPSENWLAGVAGTKGHTRVGCTCGATDMGVLLSVENVTRERTERGVAESAMARSETPGVPYKKNKQKFNRSTNKITFHIIE